MPRTEGAPQRRQRRRVDGVLLLDKPAGPSSNQCLGRIKHLLAAQKAGHTGTLDPFATGLLPVALGEATKFSQGLLEADKTYLATMRLGVVTTTADVEGEVTRVSPVACDAGAVAAAMAGFLGAIEQTPPMHSALKRDGRALYEYARAGIEIERAPRTVVIREIELLGMSGDEARFRVRCSKGTYVRTLAEDIGNALGCGAHLVALRREAVGHLSVDAALTLDAIEAMAEAEREACLLPVDALVAGVRRITLDAADAARLALGQRLPLRAAGALPGAARAYDEAGRFLGLVSIEAGVVRAQRLVGLT